MLNSSNITAKFQISGWKKEERRTKERKTLKN